jgi:hypothetical protein
MVKDDAIRETAFGLMHEREQVCKMVKSKLPSFTVANDISDLLTGKEGAAKLEVLDTIIANRARIFKRLRGPGIDSKESITPAYVPWRAGLYVR